jgi:hypothetical protein
MLLYACVFLYVSSSYSIGVLILLARGMREREKEREEGGGERGGEGGREREKERKRESTTRTSSKCQY